VQANRFRQDLFYRLNVIEIAVPALRERRADLPMLCAALLARIARDAGMAVPVLSADVVERLARQPLHGNVRELENLLHRAVALSDGDELHLDFTGSDPGNVPPADVPVPMPVPVAAPAAADPPASAVPSDLQFYLDQQERDIRVRALRESGFNRTAAAARLGLSLRQIRYRIARLGIAMPNADDAPAGFVDE
jgi:two-component system response regulator PilR (NtrC family)